jgi:putative transposase
MARPIRIEYEGALYHVTCRGNARQKIFLKDKDYRDFLDVFRDVIERTRWLAHAYCLMGNHYHLLIETPQANLSQGMRQLNGVYTQRFNRRNNRVGHIFQGRYKAYLVEKGPYYLELCRYIVLNPVRAGMVRTPEDWPWSSYSGTAGIVSFAGFMHAGPLLEQFSSDRQRAQDLYKQFVREGMGKESPLKEARGGTLLGSENFIRKWREAFKERGKSEISRQERYAARPSLEEIFAGLERDAGIAEAVSRWGYRLKEVGDYLELHYSRVSRIASKLREQAKNKT